MNIYVGNLSYKVRENDLQGVIEEYGKVDSCKIIKDRETGRFRGIAFVEMEDAAAAAKAEREAAGVEETPTSPKLSKREPITRGKQPQD